MTFEGQAKAEFIMYVTGGGRGGKRIFFSAARFFISPPPHKVHTNFHNPPPSNQPKNEYPPSSLTGSIKINIWIIVHYICLKIQETCLIRTSREL